MILWWIYIFSYLNECMVLLQKFIIPVVSILYICNLQYNVTQIVFSLFVLLGNLMQVSFWNYQQSDIMIRMITFTTYQHCHTFSCSSSGSEILFHVISPSIYSSHSNIEKWHVPKNSLYSDILPWKVSYLYWYQSTLYIWYFC